MLDGERKANWKGGEAEGRHGHTGQGTPTGAHHKQTTESPKLKERELFRRLTEERRGPSNLTLPGLIPNSKSAS